MKKKRGNLRRMAATAMAGMLAVAGIAGRPMLTGPTGQNAAVVQAADAAEYNTHGGIVAVGTGTAGIMLKGNSGQSMVGKKFRLYKLFYAENSQDGESINYTFNPECAPALKNVVAKALSKDGKQVTADSVTEYMVIDYIQTLNTNPSEGSNAAQTLEGSYSLFRYFVEDVRDELVRLDVMPMQINVKDVRSDQTVQISGLDYGYYIIDEVSAVEETHAASSLCMVDTANPTASVSLKSDYPSVTKKIREDDEADGITDRDNWNDVADYEIGQTVPYKFESDIPDMNGYDTYYYAWHDRMDAALTFQAGSVQITIYGQDAEGQEKTYTLEKNEYSVAITPANGDTFQIIVDDIKSIIDREFNRMNDLGENIYGQHVSLTYNAVLNEKAAENTGRPGFENDVRLEFSNDADSDHGGSTGFTPWDTVVCFTYKLNLQKVNDHDKTLANAKFRLYSDADCEEEVYVKEGADGYIVINRDSLGGTDHTGGKAPANAVEMSSAEDGTFTIFGLDGGTYYLKETDAPDGYRQLLDPIKIQVIPAFTMDRDSYVKGDGATEYTLKDLAVYAHIESFYNGISQEKDQELAADVEEGSANLTVINQVGMKLPVTGTPATVLILCAGAVMMGAALLLRNRKKR